MQVQIALNIDDRFVSLLRKLITKRRLMLGFGIIAATSAAVYAASVPNTFSAGQQLSAASMNANFAALASAVTNLEAGKTPPGTIVAFGGTTAPAGWVLCDGAQYNGLSATYAKLYAAIGTAFGGNASSQAFNVPDLRGRFLRGVDQGSGHDPDAAGRTAMTSGGNAGDKVGSLQTDAFAGHYHTVDGQMITWNCQTQSYPHPDASAPDGCRASRTDATGGAETRPRNANVNFIIRL